MTEFFSEIPALGMSHSAEDQHTHVSARFWDTTTLTHVDTQSHTHTICQRGWEGLVLCKHATKLSHTHIHTQHFIEVL